MRTFLRCNLEVPGKAWMLFQVSLTDSRSLLSIMIKRPATGDGAKDPSAATEEVIGAPRSLLLVEDDRSLRRYLEVVLRRTGYKVVSAADGLEAMKVVLDTPIDIVITDAIMPNLNGHELVRFLRTTPSLSRIPVILLSALEDKESRDPNHKADVYLSKPVAPEDLIEWITRLGVHAEKVD